MFEISKNLPAPLIPKEAPLAIVSRAESALQLPLDIFMGSMQAVEQEVEANSVMEFLYSAVDSLGDSALQLAHSAERLLSPQDLAWTLIGMRAKEVTQELKKAGKEEERNYERQTREALLVEKVKEALKAHDHLAEQASEA